MFPVSVKAVVEVGGRVPLLRNERAEWELPGGRLEAGEELEAAVEREVLEELGLAVECHGLVDAWTYRPNGAEGTVVIVVYDCEPRGEVDTTQPLRWSTEHSDARWFDIESLAGIEMPEPYTRSIRAASRRR
jgi:8-oxo-dGTP pyrophosphatase MutT (NUDIX family)